MKKHYQELPPLRWWPVSFRRYNRYARAQRIRDLGYEVPRRRFFLYWRTNGGIQIICIGNLAISIGRKR